MTPKAHPTEAKNQAPTHLNQPAVSGIRVVYDGNPWPLYVVTPKYTNLEAVEYALTDKQAREDVERQLTRLVQIFKQLHTTR